MDEKEEENQNIILEKVFHISFNNDSSCFCIGTEKGFRVYNTYPLKCLIKRDIEGGIRIIDVLNRSNVFAFVGTGKNENYKQNSLIFWDEHESKVIYNISFLSEIKNLKMKRTKIFLVCENKVVIYTLGNYEKIDSINTFNNKNGIFGISLDSKLNIIACPSTETGKIIIKNYDEKKDGNFIKKEINAHQTEITALTMNVEGTLVASASEKGTIIKIFRVKDCSLIQELRRGTTISEIYSLCFDFKSLYLACSSNKGTVHIFNIKNDENKNEAQNQKSVIGSFVSFLGIQNEYLNSEWSFAQYRLPYKEKTLVSFAPDNTPNVIVLTYDGMYHQGEFDPKIGGDCQDCLTQNYLKLEIQEEY
jgi:WD40 repeat protein